jgi:protein-tyrosine-phosphatase
MMVEGRRKFPSSYRQGLRVRNWSEDLRWVAERATSPGVTLKTLGTVARESLNLLIGRERSDTLTLDDPLPGLLEIGALCRNCLGAAGRRVFRRYRRQRWWRTKKRRQLLRRLRASRRILFLCKGNVCRSPFAERYARLVLPPEWSVTSAGHLDRPGRPSPAEAYTAALQLGVDLLNHRSKVVTRQLFEDADLILAFDEEQLDIVHSSYPDLWSKTFLIGLIGVQEEATVPDPFGKTEREFVRVFCDIARLIDAAVQMLRRSRTTREPAAMRSAPECLTVPEEFRR